MRNTGEHVLVSNYEKDISVIKLLRELGYEKSMAFSPRDLALKCGYLNQDGSPQVQKLARSLNRLVDSKYLSVSNVTTPLGKIIDKRYLIVGDFDAYASMRKDVVEKRKAYLEMMKASREESNRKRSMAKSPLSESR